MSHEAHARERLRYLCRIKIRKRKIFKIDLDRHITHDRGNFARKKGVVLMVRKILKLLSLESIEMCIDALEIVEFLQHGRSLLVANTGNARNIVRLIALQAQEIRKLTRGNAIALLHLSRTIDNHIGDALLRGDDARKIARQLIGILIAGHEQRVVAELLVLSREGAQDIVALPARQRHHRDVECSKQVFDERKLHAQVIVHGRALRFVLLERLHTKGRLSFIESAHDRIGMLLFDELDEHRQKAESSIGGRAIRRLHGRRHRMKRAVHKGISIDDGNSFRHDQALQRYPTPRTVSRRCARSGPSFARTRRTCTSTVREPPK